MARLARFDFTGPRGRSWSLTPVDLDWSTETIEHRIDRSIKSNSGIMSRGFEWVFDFDDLAGEIYVGGGRKVGTITATLIEVPA